MKNEVRVKVDVLEESVRKMKNEVMEKVKELEESVLKMKNEVMEVSEEVGGVVEKMGRKRKNVEKVEAIKMQPKVKKVKKMDRAMMGVEGLSKGVKKVKKMDRMMMGVERLSKGVKKAVRTNKKIKKAVRTGIHVGKIDKIEKLEKTKFQYVQELVVIGESIEKSVDVNDLEMVKVRREVQKMMATGKKIQTVVTTEERVEKTKEDLDQYVQEMVETEKLIEKMVDVNDQKMLEIHKGVLKMVAISMKIQMVVLTEEKDSDKMQQQGEEHG